MELPKTGEKRSSKVLQEIPYADSSYIHGDKKMTEEIP